MIVFLIAMACTISTIQRSLVCSAAWPRRKTAAWSLRMSIAANRRGTRQIWCTDHRIATNALRATRVYIELVARDQSIAYG